MKDIYERFKRDMRKTQESIETDIPVLFRIEKDISLRGSLRRVSKTKVLNVGLDVAVVEENNRWRKW